MVMQEVWQKIWWILTTAPPKPKFWQDVGNTMESAVTEWIGNKFISLTQWLSSMLLSTPVEYLQSNEFQAIYNMMTRMTLAAMIPYLAWHGYKVMWGKAEDADIFRIIGRCLLMPIAIRLGPVVLLTFVGIFNRLAQAVLAGTPAITHQEAMIPYGLEIGLFVFLVVYLFLVVRLIIYYAYRNYAILVLTVFLPVIVMLWAIGQGDKLRKWSKEVASLLMTQVAHAVQLLILLTMTVGAGMVSERPGIPLLLMQIGALCFMVQTPQWLSQYMQEEPAMIKAVTKLEKRILERGVKHVFGIKKGGK